MAGDHQDDWAVASPPSAPSEGPPTHVEGEQEEEGVLRPCYTCGQQLGTEPSGKSRRLLLCLGCAHQFLTGARGAGR